MGIAVKDGSIVAIVDTRIADARIGVATYVKKRSFGGATVTADRLTMVSVASAFLQDPQSSLVVDGELVNRPSDTAGAR